ncbi:MAG: DNA polymerase I, partial [Thermoguttaceae bacterium]|nr:DNA polymerase I [Thermoguttaceae bacterium]
MISLAGKTVCVVDAYGLIYQVFHAPGMEMTNAQGEPTGAAFGFVRDVLGLMRKLSPDYLLCAYDMRAKTFRSELYPEYKANRSATPDDLLLQFDFTREFLKAVGVPALGVVGFEADDVLATVARTVSELGGETILATSDKDARQLLDDRTSIYLLRKEKFYRAPELLADWGIRPDQVVDFQALVGDSSDNVPGVPLIGPKVAGDLLQKFETLEGVFDAAVGMKGKRYENIRNGRDLALLSRELVKLRTDVPLEIDWNAARLGGVDPERLRRLFQYWGFRSLIGKVDELAETFGVATAPQSDWFDGIEARRQGFLSGSASAASSDASAEKTLFNAAEKTDVSNVLTTAPPQETADGVRDGSFDFDAATPLLDRLAVSQYGCVPKPRSTDETPSDSEPTAAPDFELIGTERFASSADFPFPPLNSTQNAETVPTAATLVDDAEKLAALKTRLDSASVLSLATIVLEEAEFGRVRPRFATLCGLALAVSPSEAFYLPFRGPLGTPTLDAAATLETLRDALESPTLPKIGAEIKFDALVLRDLGVRLRGVVFDVLLADYLVRSGETRRTLAEIAETYLDRSTFDLNAATGTGKKRIPLDLLPPSTLAERAADAVLIPLAVAPILREKIAAEPALERLALDLETPLVETLAEMELSGIAIEPERFRAANADFLRRQETLETEIRAAIAAVDETPGFAETINLNSPKQLQRVLFDDLKLPIIKKTKTGPSVDAEVLEELALFHPIPEKIVELRRLTKLRGTYLESLPTQALPSTGRVCATFNQAATATGRLSSSEPNLQNIPARSENGKIIRAGFVPDASLGFDAFVSCDYSQIELRVLAHFSGDPELRRAFADGEDVHALVASRLFGVAQAAVTPDMRRKAKAVNFGLVYGQTSFGLSKAINVSAGEAAAYIDAFFATYPGVLTFFDRVLDNCARRGFVQTLLGRRRALSGVRGARGRKTLNFPERAAINAVVQGTAADLMKLAMLAVWRRLKKEGWIASRWSAAFVDAPGFTKFIQTAGTAQIAPIAGTVRTASTAQTAKSPKYAAPSLFDGLDDFVAEQTALAATDASTIALSATSAASPLNAASTAAVGTPERARLLLQIHDELLFETCRADADALAKIVVEEMRLGDPLTVPLQIDAEIGA